jgi:DNA-binding MarR family transcriptional regulator
MIGPDSEHVAGRPLVGADGPVLANAMHALVTYATSTAFRESVMQRSAFPFPGDLSAFLVVNQLIYRGAARPTDLADAIDTGRSNMSKIVARLEDAGLVVRAPDPNDSRAVVVILTPAGRVIGGRILDAAALAPALADWDDDEVRTLTRLVVRLAHDLDALPDHPLRAVTGLALGGD